MVVDDYVLAGSSNMGTKSLKLTGDHEMNFEARSQEFADQTRQVLEDDIARSTELDDISLGIKQRLVAKIHKSGARIWG